MSGSSEHESPDEATLAAYLSDQLDPTRAEAFEVYCLRNPEFARRVESDLILRAGFKRMSGPNIERRTSYRRRVALAIAASVTLIVGCGLLLLRPARPGALIAYQSATAVPSPLLAGPHLSVTLIRLREGSTVHRINAPREAGVLAVRVAPDSPPGPRGYTMGITVESEPIPRTVSLDTLHANSDGYIEVYLPLAALVGNSVRVTVMPSPPTDTQTNSFRFQVAYAENAPADTP